MQYEVIGEITKINSVSSGQSKAGNDWKKVEFVVETKEDYNNIYPLEVFGTGENVSKVDNFVEYNKVGDTVKALFNVSAREYNDKYYTNLSAWRVENQNNTNNETNVDNLVDDDMPF